MGFDSDGRVWRMGDGMGWGGWVMMSLVLILCLAVLGGFLYLLLHATRPGPSMGPSVGPDQVAGPRRSSAQDVLDDRLARGEIDVAEYQARSNALRGG